MGFVPYFFLSSLMGLFSVNPFICRAVWAYALLDSLDKPISEPALLLSCFCAYRTFDAALSHFFIVETPIPKAKRSGIGKLNNPAQRRVHTRDLFLLRKLYSCASSLNKLGVVPSFSSIYYHQKYF